MVGLGVLALLGCAVQDPPVTASAEVPEAKNALSSLGRIVGIRRLTEAQYRNSIADIFGADIQVSGRFEPIVRPPHQLIAVGAAAATISPSGMEQYDAMGRAIAAQVFDEEHRPIFASCAPQEPDQVDAQCARHVLARLGRYLFRRPLSEEEQAFYVATADAAVGTTGSFYTGLELALAAMLVSPNFLYIIESAEPDPSQPEGMSLDSYSRAARLSFLLWNTTPDDDLLERAEQRGLMNDAELAAMAGKMVRSPRLEDGVRAFFGDMLMFEMFDQIAKDPIIYRRFNQDLAKAFPEQMLRMIAHHLLTLNGDYHELFTTRRTFVNRALGPLYDVPVAESQGWVPFEFSADDERGGLIGQAGFLALYSHSGRSSPTLRGRAIRELLLCQPVPNPPGNVNFTAVQDTDNKALPTARIRLATHNSDPLCSGCHRITDPIGLTLERFDGIGAVRTRENDADIDTSGVFDGNAIQGALGLGKALAANESTAECVVVRAWEYATGRPSNREKASSAVSTAMKAFAADGYRIPALFLRVATMREAYLVEHGPPVSGAPEIASAINPARGE